MTDIALRRATSIAGGQSALARKIGKRQSHVWAWLKSGRVPAEMCAPIERATGVPRHELRPDLFDAPAEQKDAAE